MVGDAALSPEDEADFQTIAVVNRTMPGGVTAGSCSRRRLRHSCPTSRWWPSSSRGGRAGLLGRDSPACSRPSPYVVLSTSWGGDLDSTCSRRAPRPLRELDLRPAVAESSAQRLGRAARTASTSAVGGPNFLHTSTRRPDLNASSMPQGEDGRLPDLSSLPHGAGLRGAGGCL
jgi:hypothetical protein